MVCDRDMSDFEQVGSGAQGVLGYGWRLKNARKALVVWSR